MLAWRHIALVALGLVLASLLLAGLGLARSLWLRVDGLVLPWQRQEASLAGDGDIELVTLRERNALLNAENVRLAGRLSDYESIRGEGGIEPQAAIVAYGQVISRTRRSGRALVEIDVGALVGVRVGMACLAGWSLAGVVVGEERERSLVQLITDPESRVPAALFSLQGDYVGEGLLVGDPESSACRLLYIDDHPDLVVEAGMEVLTSGTGGRFPSGLVLGAVQEIGRSPGDDHWDILVQPFRRVNHLTGFQIADIARIGNNAAGE